MKRIVLIFILVSLPVSALEKGKKIPVKVLKHSTSKKTIILNLGSDAGVVKTDNAFLYNERGVIAIANIYQKETPGVEVIAPKQSIWSLTRIARSDDIFNGAAFTLESGGAIAEAVPSDMVIKENPVSSPELTPSPSKAPEASSGEEFDPDHEIFENTHDFLMSGQEQAPESRRSRRKKRRKRKKKK